ncbi:MAG: 23S rRNA (pseudouridine(1915)-N(3))-methyltransferase RlmH [Oscillospiraceae bacterium]|nr:23S rRNA (pseudouridine(1915)-N(3))-methyltransferase RlmH [Oscillospiraceae bacterium]
MWNIKIVCVGKLKEKFFLDAVGEYEKRLSHFCRLEIRELSEERLPDHPSLNRIAAALQKEEERIRPQISGQDPVIALCVEGVGLSSEKLAGRMEGWAMEGRSRMTLVIGGSYGLSPGVKEQASLRLSLSPMTFPHHLARVMLLEQLYRCFQIREGTKYHK